MTVERTGIKGSLKEQLDKMGQINKFNLPCETCTANQHTSDLHSNHHPHRPKFISSSEHFCPVNHLLTISTCRGSKLVGAEEGTANWIFFLSLGSTSTWLGTEASMSLDPEESDSQWKGEVTGKDHRNHPARSSHY